MAKDTIEDTAERLFQAREGRDLTALRTLYDAHARFWYNTSGAELDLDTHIARLRALFEVVPDLRHTLETRHLLASYRGYVERLRLDGALPDGSKLMMRVCKIFHLRGDAITRVEEYLDSGQASRLRNVLPRDLAAASR